MQYLRLCLNDSLTVTFARLSHHLWKYRRFSFNLGLASLGLGGLHGVDVDYDELPFLQGPDLFGPDVLFELGNLGKDIFLDLLTAALCPLEVDTLHLVVNIAQLRCLHLLRVPIPRKTVAPLRIPRRRTIACDSLVFLEGLWFQGVHFLKSFIEFGDLFKF